MAKTIKIKTGNQVISIESDSAGVPDVTEGTGPDLMQLQDDAMASPNEANAEFNAAIDDSAAEKEDNTEAVEKANESFFDAIFGIRKPAKKAAAKRGPVSTFDAIFGLEDGNMADPTQGVEDGEEPTSEEPPAPAGDEGTSETPTEAPAEGGDDGAGAGDVTEGDGVTTIDTGDTVITITSSDNAEAGSDAPAAEPPATSESPETSTDQAPTEGGESAPVAPDGKKPEDPNAQTAAECGGISKSIESFFDDLGL